MDVVETARGTSPSTGRPAASAARTSVELTRGSASRPSPVSKPARPTTCNGTVRCNSALSCQEGNSASRSAPITTENACSGKFCWSRRTVRRVRLSTPRSRSMALTFTRGPERRRGQLAHLQPMGERRQLLAERVPERGDDPELVDRRRLENVEGGHLMRQVRRIEAPSEDRDAHRPSKDSRGATPGAGAPRTPARRGRRWRRARRATHSRPPCVARPRRR